MNNIPTRVVLKINEIQQDVLRLHREVGHLGLTQTELEVIASSRFSYPLGKSTLRTRRKELENEGYIVRTDKKRVNLTGGMERVYVAVKD